MKQLLILFIALIAMKSSYAQPETPISVYSCDAYTTPTHTEIINEPYYKRSCVELFDVNDYWFQQNDQILIQSGTSIHADQYYADCHIGPFTGQGNMHWKIAPDATDFDVAVMNNIDMNHVEKLKKLELGIQIPPEILTKIYNFINNVDVSPSDKLNPFVDWNIDVEAYFSHADINKGIDGFFFRSFERDISANDWTDIPTSYPFRVRFSPPEIGIWQCQIQIKINGIPTYFAAPFSFKVIETGAHGYVNVHANERNLELDGRIIMPVGQNLPFPVKFLNSIGKIDVNGDPYGLLPDQTHKAARVDAWLEYQQDLIDYHAMGGKYLRITQSPQANLIEFEKKGNYYDRLHYAWETDKFIQFCDDNNMMINFNLMFQEPLMLYGQYDATVWDFSHYYEDGAGNYYYNASDPYPAYCYNDSGMEMPSNMFIDEDDLKYHEQRMRYYISRYGYSTSIMQFELLSESFHLDELDHNVVAELSAAGDWARHAIDNYLARMTDYTKTTMGHTEHLFGIHAYKPDATLGDDISLDLENIDVIGFSTYETRPDRYIQDKPNPGFDIENDENSYYKTYTEYSNGYGKPVVFCEQGGILYPDGAEFSANPCSNYSIRKIDDVVTGFTGIAGFFAWDGFGQFDNSVAWNSTIKSSNWMNGDQVINVLSTSWGDWKQGRQIEKIEAGQAHTFVKENQYYVDHYDENAVGYIYNRTYNYLTKQTGTPCSDSDIDDEDGDDIHEDFQNLESIDWQEGSNNLYVLLKANTNYKITWHDFQTGIQIGEEECDGTGLDHRFKLKFPELTVYEAEIDRPVLWYVIEQYNCQQGIAQSGNSPEQQKLRSDLLYTENTEDNISFRISPNPFKDHLILDLVADEYIEIFTISNERVFSAQLEKGENKLNVDFLASGVYYLKFSSKNETFKIVKM